MQSSRTKAVAKYQAKVGLAARTYKLKVHVADAFKEACAASGASQASVLTQFMIAYTENHELGIDANSDEIKRDAATEKFLQREVNWLDEKLKDALARINMLENRNKQLEIKITELELKNNKKETKYAHKLKYYSWEL